MTDSDFSYLEGTNCYCSPESADAAREIIGSLPLEGIHYIGTGDYHYVSLFWAERIKEPFTLVLLDNHPDDQPAAFSSDLLSCGDWVAHVRRLPMAMGTVWIKSTDDWTSAGQFPVNSVYLSIDLDVLSEEYARTDWDQGSMTLDEMSDIISDIKKRYRIIGTDICGGLSDSKGATEADKAINARTISRICAQLK